MSKRSRLASVAALLALVLGSAGCGADKSGDSGPSSAGGSTQGKKVGLVYCASSVAWCGAYTKTVKDNLAKAGIETTVLTSNFNQSEYNQFIDQLIAQKPAVIASGAADANGAVPGILRAHAAGIPYVNLTNPLPEAAQKGITTNILANTDALGQIAAEGLVDGMKAAGHDSGNVIGITGTGSQGIVKAVVASFKKTMAKYPQYKLVAMEDGNWDPAKTQQITQQLLAQYASKGGVQGIWAEADFQAVGSIAAVKQAGLPLGAEKKGVIITSSNCSAQGVTAIKNGDLYATGTESPISLGTTAAEAIIKVIKGEKQEKNQIGEEIRIDATNVDTEGSRCDY